MSPRPRHASRGTTQATPARAVAAHNTRPTAEASAKARDNAGAVSHQRKQQPQTPAERWAAEVDGVLERFKAWAAEAYADEPEGGDDE